MNKPYTFLVVMLLAATSLFAQKEGFEKALPSDIKVKNGSEISISSLYYKEGSKSLQWSFKSNSTLEIPIEPLCLTSKLEHYRGLYLWIYNERAHNDSVRFEFLNEADEVVYWFSFNIPYVGWRAAWTAFEHMNSNEVKDKTIVKCKLVAPHYNGRLFIDRITFPVRKINSRVTPDQQMPYNNRAETGSLWHWSRLWEWEQYRYDLPLEDVNKEMAQELDIIAKRLTDYVLLDKEPKGAIKKAYKLFETLEIYPSKSGHGYVGAPFVSPDEMNRKKGEWTIVHLETMLSGFAYDYYFNHSKRAKRNYLLLWDYAIEQGFAYGSAMGTNHHYGYKTRKIYTTAWLMRDVIYQSSSSDKIIAALLYWSGLQETRINTSDFSSRNGLLDAWHTLLFSRFISTMIIPEVNERALALQGLSRWLSASLNYTPGTVGGLKPDGTTFHHGGFYPAYTSGVLAEIGKYIAFVSQTKYQLTEKARTHLKGAFIAMRNYCNFYQWGIGISGRHPFGGQMNADDVEAFAHLAVAGDLSQTGSAVDKELAESYLRLIRHNKTPLGHLFKDKGYTASKAPEGFWVYNYGATGIFRRSNWMVTLKGYNRDVWCSEIYKKDNRYGRYQSYGSHQILGKGTPYVTREGSGYVPNGWDWNRLPGTTTIHLPFSKLDSPNKGTTMARSTENFAGATTLEGKNGMFAMKLTEADIKYYTPDFVARKSIFCFDNRMICIGSGISNSNVDYPTETTLFQTSYNGAHSLLESDDFFLSDNYDNYYHVVDGNVKRFVGKQRSRDEKNRALNEGDFSSAWIDHGTSPKDATYEYLVLIQPTHEQLVDVKEHLGYQVISRSNHAHIVYDEQTQIKAYAIFDDYEATSDSIFTHIPAETMVMCKKSGSKELVVSVCDPNLNLEVKGYTTMSPSRVIVKEITIKGLWNATAPNAKVKVKQLGNNLTHLTLSCQHGQPVEFTLHKQ